MATLPQLVGPETLLGAGLRQRFDSSCKLQNRNLPLQAGFLKDSNPAYAALLPWAFSAAGLAPPVAGFLRAGAIIITI